MKIELPGRKYDMSLMVWSWKNDRDELAQFVPIAPYRTCLALTPRHNTDFGLFLRAFMPNSWTGVALITVATFACLLLANFLGLDDDREMISSVWWPGFMSLTCCQS